MDIKIEYIYMKYVLRIDLHKNFMFLSKDTIYDSTTEREYTSYDHQTLMITCDGGRVREYSKEYFITIAEYRTTIINNILYSE